MSSTARTLHFISGLPRSGSTLLSALLQQNPRFNASMSSPVAGLVHDLLNNMSAGNEYSMFISDQQRQRILRGVFDNYYGAEYPAEVIFDTSRAWCMRMSLLDTLFPASKVIACVRDVPWIVDSIERQVQNNALSPSLLFNYQAGGTVYTRADNVANGEGLLGFAYNALKQAFYGEHSANVLVVRYESLVTDPHAVLRGIYAFIGEAPFAHDLDNIRFDASEFDQRAGTPGLHAVRPKVAAATRQTLLPPDLFRRFENDAFWQYPQLNTKSVAVL